MSNKHKIQSSASESPMQKAFTNPDRNTDLLPSSEEITSLQTDQTNMLSASINLPDGARYLWEGDQHEK